jgi:hypothetical protein
MHNSGVSDLYFLWLNADLDSGFLINPQFQSSSITRLILGLNFIVKKFYFCKLTIARSRRSLKPSRENVKLFTVNIEYRKG